MSLKEELQTYLLAHPGLADLVGTRIYMTPFPQDVAYPCLAYQKISSVRQYTHDGYSKTRTRMQITIFSHEGEEAEDILEELYSAMEAMHIETGLAVDPVAAANEIDIYGYTEDLHQVPVDFIIWHQGV